MIRCQKPEIPFQLSATKNEIKDKTWKCFCVGSVSVHRNATLHQVSELAQPEVGPQKIKKLKGHFGFILGSKKDKASAVINKINSG